MKLNDILSHEFFSYPIPTQMSTSTLACPPSKVFIEQYASKEKKLKMKLSYVEPIRPDSSRPLSRALKQSTCSINNECSDSKRYIP